MYTGGRKVEESDVTQLVGYAQEASIFSMVDAVLEYKPVAASKLLQKLLQDGAAPAYILTMLARQVRMLILAKDLKKQGKLDAEIMSKTGIKKDFALRKTLEQAQKYSWKGSRKSTASFWRQTCLSRPGNMKRSLPWKSWFPSCVISRQWAVNGKPDFRDFPKTLKKCCYWRKI